MGLEHVGFVVGANLDDFSRRHRAVLTRQQFQSSTNEPVYILFDDYTHVKFHQRSLKDACELEGRAFVGFQHVDWQPADELAGPIRSGLTAPVVPIDLHGRTALVTGASRGIGRAIAVRLAEAGARVVVHYRSDREGAQATVDAIASFGEGHAVSADLTDATAIQAMFAPSAPFLAAERWRFLGEGQTASF